MEKYTSMQNLAAMHVENSGIFFSVRIIQRLASLWHNAMQIIRNLLISWPWTLILASSPAKIKLKYILYVATQVNSNVKWHLQITCKCLANESECQCVLQCFKIFCDWTPLLAQDPTAHAQLITSTSMTRWQQAVIHSIPSTLLLLLRVSCYHFLNIG